MMTMTVTRRLGRSLCSLFLCCVVKGDDGIGSLFTQIEKERYLEQPTATEPKNQRKCRQMAKGTDNGDGRHGRMRGETSPGAPRLDSRVRSTEAPRALVKL